MAVGKEIRAQIASVKNTQKITKAMEMVAASKMRKAQDRMAASKPYAGKMRQVISHLANAHPEYKHPFLEVREAKRVGYIIISTDRGLCGGLNINLFKTALNAMTQWEESGVEIDMCLVGSKAESFFKRLGNTVSTINHIGDKPHLDELIGTVKVMLDSYMEGNLDQLFLVENEFVNSMTQQSRVSQLIPVQPAEDEALKHYWDYLYEPDSKEVLDGLLTRYIESQVYQAVVENIACEMSARMVAMKAATDNAGDMINELQLIYNKARQAAITQELSEIVSGASAV
ncbi:MAG: F0F1 ATP synthase subunit gamma [Thiothrix sp.]|nr:MAG: F0F1 ATP synthase subunit gamma [Thiothrix sp.]